MSLFHPWADEHDNGERELTAFVWWVLSKPGEEDREKASSVSTELLEEFTQRIREETGL